MPRLMLGYFARVGKDTTADILQRDHGEWLRLAIATPVRKAIECFKQEIGDTSDRKYRDAMIALAEEARAVIDPEVFIKLTLAQIGDAQNVVVTDMRKKLEYDRLREIGFVYVRILRPGVVPLNGEHELANVTPDYVIVNDGSLDDMTAKVAGLLKQIALGYIPPGLYTPFST